MTSTPHSPECAANTTFSTPTNSSVCQRWQAEQDAGDLAGGQVHRGHDHAVEEQPQVDRRGSRAPRRPPCPSSGSRRTRGRSSRPTAATAARRRTPWPRRSARTPTSTQLPATPLRRTMSVTRFGVSLLNVVATIESPASHHGTERPDAKNSDVLLPARLPKNSAGHEADEQRERNDDPVDELEVHGSASPMSQPASDSRQVRPR